MNLYPITNQNIIKPKNLDFLHLAKLEKAVFAKRPSLGETYLKDGNLSLFEFTSRQLVNPINTQISDLKKNEIIKTITKETSKRLNAEIAKSVGDQLKQNFQVITADHHGPLTDPRFLNSNLLIHNALLQNDQTKNIIVLSCANVSFDNISFPRGHEFHTINGEVASMNQLVFFPRKVRPLNVSGHPAYGQENLVQLKDRIQAFKREGIIKQELGDKLENIFNEIYTEPSVLEVETFSEQVTKTNFNLWKKLVGENSTNLIYLEQEQIVNALIVDNHLYRDTVINDILFKKSVTEVFIKYFDGISRGFSLENKTGTYLFWGLPKDQKYRTQLWKEGNKLVSSDKTFSVELTPVAIAKAIASKELIPSTLLSFIILSFYYGLSLVGGGRQTTYLTEMKNAYISFVKAINDDEDYNFVEDVSTTKLAATFPSVAFVADKNNNLIPATMLDLLLYGDQNYMETIAELAKKITIQQAIARELPKFYRIEIPEENQKENLKNISVSHIDKLTNFSSIVRTSGYIV